MEKKALLTGWEVDILIDILVNQYFKNIAWVGVIFLKSGSILFAIKYRYDTDRYRLILADMYKYQSIFSTRKPGSTGGITFVCLFVRVVS